VAQKLSTSEYAAPDVAIPAAIMVVIVVAIMAVGLLDINTFELSESLPLPSHANHCLQCTFFMPAYFILIYTTVPFRSIRQ
jgi:hypothetical protein